MKVTLLGPFNDCLIWTPSQRPLRRQIKLLEQLTWVKKYQVQFQKPLSHADATTIQQHVVGDVVSSGNENGKKSRKQRISESIILNDGSCASTTLLFSLYRIKTFRALSLFL